MQTLLSCEVCARSLDKDKKRERKHWRPEPGAVDTESETAITLSLRQLISASLVRSLPVVCGRNNASVCVCVSVKGSVRWDASRWGGTLMDCAVTSRPAIYGSGAADERGAVNRPAGGVFHTGLAFMKNTGTALPTAPPGPP